MSSGGILTWLLVCARYFCLTLGFLTNVELIERLSAQQPNNLSGNPNNYSHVALPLLTDFSCTEGLQQDMKHAATMVPPNHIQSGVLALDPVLFRSLEAFYTRLNSSESRTRPELYLAEQYGK